MTAATVAQNFESCSRKRRTLKTQHIVKRFGLDVFVDILNLMPDALGSKSFSPSLGPQENTLFDAHMEDFWGVHRPSKLQYNLVFKARALL